MLMLNFNGISLPKNLLDEFLSNNVIGLFIKNGKINGRTLRATKFDMELISQLINDSIENPKGEQLVILSKDGQIIFGLNVNSNNISIDENGYITIDIGTDSKVIHSINNKDFMICNSKEEIDKNYAKLLTSGLGLVEFDSNFVDGSFKGNSKKF